MGLAMNTYVAIYLAGRIFSIIGPYEYTQAECERLLVERQILECVGYPDKRECRCEQHIDHQSLRMEASPS